MDYNPFIPEVRENPFPYYTYLRQHAPAYQVPGAGFWVISRYDDVFSGLKSTQMLSSSIIITGFTGDLDPFPPEAPAISLTIRLTTRDCVSSPTALLPPGEWRVWKLTSATWCAT